MHPHGNSQHPHGGFLRRWLLKLHGVPDAHAHAHPSLDTEGLTIDWARLYDLLTRALLMRRQGKYVKSILALAQIQPGESVLDVGCGTGTLAIAARLNAPEDSVIHGLDASPAMIERARQKAAQADANVDFQPGLAEALPFADATFDLVMSSMVMHHLPGDLKARAFAEMYRVLKPGGRLLVVDFEPPANPLVRAFLTQLLGRGMLSIDNRTLPPLLKAAGFADVQLGKTGSRLATSVSGVKVGKRENSDE